MDNTSRKIYERRRFLQALVSGAAALGMSRWAVLGEESPGEGTSGRKPNIVFIMIDDLGWKDVGFMGSDFYETPHIDKLAGEGVVFTNAYSNGPNCAPTRASFITGQYSPRHKVFTVGTAARGASQNRKLIPVKNTLSIATGTLTLPKALKKAGYVSCIIGKAHGHNKDDFDYAPAPGKSKQKKITSEDPKRVYTFTQLANEFIEQNKDRPFFLYLSHHAVHTRIEAKPETVAKYEKKQGSSGQNHPKYAALVEHVDDSVGSVMGQLERLGLRDNTIVVFFSDNGGHVAFTSMAPLRGSKGTMYEGGIRVPMVVRWPGVTQPGTRCETPVIGIDFFATFLETAGLQQPANHVLDGESIVPLLKGKTNWNRKEIYWHFPAYLEAYDKEKQGNWRSTPWSAVRQGDYKLIEFFEDGHLELYNLKEDIGERKNLVKAQPEKAKELHDLLKHWRASMNAPAPTEKNPEYKPL